MTEVVQAAVPMLHCQNQGVGSLFVNTLLQRENERAGSIVLPKLLLTIRKSSWTFLRRQLVPEGTAGAQRTPAQQWQRD